MEVQFSSHALDRLMGRMSNVVSYADVQSKLSNQQLRSGHYVIEVKKLDHVVRVDDVTAIGGKVQGNIVVAHVDVVDGGAMVRTVALRM